MAEVTVAELLKRIEGLEYIINRSGLDQAGFLGGALKPMRVDKDGDMDFDAYTSTSWDGDSFSTGTGTINWNTDFGVPPGAKMVFIYADLRDSSGSEAGGILRLRAKSTSTGNSFLSRSRASDELTPAYGWIPVAPDGTSYYSITASGTDTCDIWISVVKYER